MPPKRSPTLAPPPADGAALHARYTEALRLTIAIPGPLVARLQQLATDDNRSLKQEAEWLLWGAIHDTMLASEIEDPVPPAGAPLHWPNPEDTP